MSTIPAISAESPAREAPKPSFRRRLVASQSWQARLLKRTYRFIMNFSVPAPKILILPMLWFFVALRNVYHFALRVFICEPLFKASCFRYGKNLHTGCFFHWIQGKGAIVLGDNVTVDGKCSISFAARFSDRPTLQIGDNTGIGHGCSFTIAKLISIGRNCNLSGDIDIMDSNAHRTDPTARWAYQPPDPEEILPVIIRDGVWIGKHCILFPGVRIGEGSVISAGSVVRGHVPSYCVVAGNPAKIVFRLKKPDPANLQK
jgi:acetyltransferase-like isoleucine patch superfamily enzyme